MSASPDGKSGSVERVTFTRPAAQRISRVVRTVEAGQRDASSLTFNRHGNGGRKSESVFRICTYAGEWPIGSFKNVTFKNQTSTPNTAAAMNLFFPLEGFASNSEDANDCAIARDGKDWYLIQVVHTTETLFKRAQLEETKLEFGRQTVIVVGYKSANTVSIAVVTCATATT